MVLTPEGKLVIFLGIINLLGLFWATRSILKWRKKSLTWKFGWVLLCLFFPLLGTIIYAVKIDKIFQKREILALFLATILIGFMMSFRQWGLESFSAVDGLINWLKSCIITGIALSLHASFQKKIASYHDANISYHIWPLGIGLALLLSFITDGWIVFAAVFTIHISTPWLLRPGRITRESHIMPSEEAKIALAGPLIHIVIAIITKGVLLFTDLSFLHEFMAVNIWIAIFTIIPFSLATSPWRRYFTKEYSMVGPTAYGTRFLKGNIPVGEGEYAVFGARTRWAFSLVFIISASVFLMVFDPITSFLLSLALGLIAFFTVYYKVSYKYFKKDTF